MFMITSVFITPQSVRLWNRSYSLQSGVLCLEPSVFHHLFITFLLVLTSYTVPLYIIADTLPIR